MIKDKLKNKTPKEIAKIKATEIAKLDLRGKFVKDDFEIEIVSEIKKIEVKEQSGIEYFAKAWRNGKQVGFGKDGSVEIERFRVFNPPILVDDPNGDILIDEIDPHTKEKKVRKLKEDLERATKESLIHTIQLVAKDDKNIVKGKVGNTTSTLYTSSDGTISSDDQSTWNDAHDALTGSLPTSNTGYLFARYINPDYMVRRYFGNFNTSVLSGEEVVSTYFSGYVNSKTDFDSRSYNIYSSTASDTIVAGDFDLAGTTAYATAITVADISTGGYNNWTFNSTGISAINLSGLTKISIRDVTKDVADIAPTSSGSVQIEMYQSYYTGTTRDPKLVVVHAPAVRINPQDIIWF